MRKRIKIEIIKIENTEISSWMWKCGWIVGFLIIVVLMFVTWGFLCEKISHFLEMFSLPNVLATLIKIVFNVLALLISIICFGFILYYFSKKYEALEWKLKWKYSKVGPASFGWKFEFWIKAFLIMLSVALNMYWIFSKLLPPRESLRDIIPFVLVFGYIGLSLMGSILVFFNERYQKLKALIEDLIEISEKPDSVCISCGYPYKKRWLGSTCIWCGGNVIDLKDNDIIKPDYRSAYFKRAMYYNQEGKYDKAIKDFTKLIEIDPNNPYSYIDRALCYKELGLYDKAIADLNKAIEINPELVKNEKVQNLLIFLREHQKK